MAIAAFAAFGTPAQASAAPADCTDLTTGNAVIVVAGPITGFNPMCVIVNSGQPVTWSNLDALAHDPGSHDANDSTFCFRKTFQTGSTLASGTQWSVTLTYDGTTAKNGARECELDSTSTSSEAIIKYQCWIPGHQGMQGIIVVRS